MCAVWPGRIAAGSKTDLAMMSMDILPTLFEAAGLSVPDDLDGRSFLPALQGRDQPPLRSEWLFTRREGGIRYGGKTIEAIRVGEWKLLQNSPFEPLELCNLSADLREQNNLAAKTEASSTSSMRNCVSISNAAALYRGNHQPDSHESLRMIRNDVHEHCVRLGTLFVSL